MAGCERCGDDESLNYSCNYCSGSFCTSHRLPENHRCPGLLSANTHGPDFRSSESSSDSIIARIFGRSEDEGSGIARKDHPGMKTYDGDLNPGEPASSGKDPVPGSYDPSKEPAEREPEWDSSPDVAPDGSIVHDDQPDADQSHDDEGGVGIAWTALGLLLLPIFFIYGIFRRVLSVLLGILTRPVPLVLFIAAVAVAAHGFGVVDIPFDAAASGLGAMLNSTSNGTADASSSDHQQGYNTSMVEAEFLELLNEERESRGLSPVTRWGTLTEMGDAHADNMAEHDYIGHKQPDTGKTIEDRYRERGLLPKCELPTSGREYYPGAENAAGAVVDGRVTYPGASKTYYISDEADLARFLFDSWMDSSGHRRVMMLESAEQIGLGLAITDSGDVYAALEFC